MRFKTLVVLMSLLSGIVSIAYAEDGLTTIELLGRRVYRNGSDGSQTEISATLGASNDAVSATTFACANCHGLEGEGKQEGGLNVPAINSQHLVTNILSKTSQPRIYDDNLLIRIITKGISAQNKPLSAAMPRYNLTAKQAQALLAYLKRLGSTSDVDVGVIASEVQLATVLPLTGPQAATGKLLKATLDACIAEANSQGLIYGRKMSLTALDSGSTKEEILAVTKRLISETKPFALITGYFPEVSTDIYQLLQNEKLPVIAPLSFEPNANPSASPAFFYFLPSYADQSRALIDYWLAHLPNGKNLAPNDKNSAQAKLTIVYSDRASNLNVVAAIRAQLQYHALNAQAEIALAQLNSKQDVNQITKLKTANTDAIFFLGNAQELIEFNLMMTKTDKQPILLGLLAMLGADVINMPDLAMTKMLLASPFNLSEPGLQQFATLLNQHSASLQSPGLQRIACAAVTFATEGLKRSGKRLSRDKFTHALEEIENFTVDIIPPLKFDSNNRQGTRGAYILTIDTKAGSLSPPSAWVTPADVHQ